MKRKRREYFESGVRLLWIVNPGPRSVDVYTSPEDPVHLSTADAIGGGDVLPGFTAQVGEFFAPLDLRR